MRGRNGVARPDLQASHAVSDHLLPLIGVYLFWWTPHASAHSTEKGAGKFALTKEQAPATDDAHYHHAPDGREERPTLWPLPAHRLALCCQIERSEVLANSCQEKFKISKRDLPFFQASEIAGRQLTSNVRSANEAVTAASSLIASSGRSGMLLAYLSIA